ncbi:MULTISPECIES: hypothetical protein [unclassified Serratia (in: enterobacteria)]|uniref:hypothetical protein n=1 Tax=unclassified Serratia (in: enterobacteria) TaxID=2647522 RepID=UPI0030767C76
MNNSTGNSFQAVMPKVTIEIPTPLDFTGRIIVNLENGKLKCWHQPRPDEFTGTLEVFMELAKQAGWSITPHKENDDESWKN